MQTYERNILGKDRILGPGFVPQSAPLACSRRVTHPVYLVVRNDEWNPFHATEDLFNAFLVLLVHNVSAADLQVTVSTAAVARWAVRAWDDAGGVLAARWAVEAWS